MKQHLLLRRLCRTNVIWGVYRDFHSYNNIETHKFDGTMNRKPQSARVIQMLTV